MKKFCGILLGVVLAATIYGSPAAAANPNSEGKSAASAKKTQWQGHIVRISKDHQTMSIRGGRSPHDNFERQVKFDATTQWTKGGKAADQDDFKEGSFVIVEGNVDKKGMLHADRIDLRLPR